MDEEFNHETEEKPKEVQQKLPLETKYSQKWHLYNLAKTNEKRLFYELLADLCKIIKEPEYKEGRPPISLRDMVFCCGLKLYSNYSGRKVISDLVLAQRAGLIQRVPHFNTIKDFLNCSGTYDLLSKLLTITAIPLGKLETQYSIDSSGFGSYEMERWQKIKWDGKKDKRNYLKGHIMIGTKTNTIVSCEVTPGNFADVKQAPRLLLKAKDNFKVKEVSCDKAYSSKLVFRIIESIGAIPYIPFKYTTHETKPDAPMIWNKMFLYFRNHKEEFEKHYHRRSNVETTFSMIKLRFGEFLKSKNYTAQRNELVMKFICHNIACLIQEIYENKIHFDFREIFLKFVERKIPEEYNSRDGSLVDDEDF